MNGLNIVVMVKVVPKPEEVKVNLETKTLDRRDAESIINPPDKNAVELAVSLKERYGGKVTLMSMAPPFVDEFMKLMEAMGADETVLLSDRAFAMADTYPTTKVLAEGVKKMGDVDLIICGEESADGGTGNVPPGIAEWLGIAQATYIEDIEYNEKEDRFICERSSTTGHEILSIPRPAVVSVELGINTPRFPDFHKVRELDKDYQMTIWDNKVLKLADDTIGLKGSKTIVSTLSQSKGKDRLHKMLSGDINKIADEIATLIIEKSL